MYSVINRFQQAIIGAISSQDVADYEWLLQNIARASAASYQEKYRKFWGMNNAAGLSSGFQAAYFGALSTGITQSPTISSLCQTLYNASTQRGGKKTHQFSFATKLLHMIDPRLPIYSSEIARFYLFQRPSGPPQQRITSLIAFHNFLINEYARVISSGQLTGAIVAFQQQLKPQRHTDEKILDWLIWALVRLVDDGALLNGQIAYV